MDRTMKKLAPILLSLILGIAMGYAWRCIQIVNAYQVAPVAEWIASEGVKAAMQKMGPRYPYRMVGEILYVDTGKGWQRLRYGREIIVEGE